MAWSFNFKSSRAARGTNAVGWSSSSCEAEEEEEFAKAEGLVPDAATASRIAVVVVVGSRGGGGESGG